MRKQSTNTSINVNVLNVVSTLSKRASLQVGLQKKKKERNKGKNKSLLRVYKLKLS